MAKFLSGPPGGRTLPQTPTRLSDLAGGVYGPGASVASTGVNAQRASVRAGITRAAGETWEDVLEYYLVCLPCRTFPGAHCFLSSSMLTAVKSILHIVSGKSSIKAVYMLLLAVLHLEAKALALFRGTTSWHENISASSHGEYGRMTHQIPHKQKTSKSQ